MPDEPLHDETLGAARAALAVAPRPTDGDLAETRARFHALRDGPGPVVVPLANAGRPRRRRRPLVLAATAAVAAAAALAGVSLSGVLSFGPAEASASQRLANALSLKDAVVHYRTVSDIPAGPGETVRISYEVWEAAGRRLTIADEGNGPIESSVGDGLWSFWSPSRETIVSTPVTGDTDPTAIFGPTIGELVDGLRDGTLVAEPATLAGRDVLAVDGEQGRTLFDPETYRPLEIQYPAGDRPVVYRYDLFEAEPRSEASLAALSLAARHPGARQVTDPALYSVVAGELYPNG